MRRLNLTIRSAVLVLLFTLVSASASLKAQFPDFPPSNVTNTMD